MYRFRRKVSEENQVPYYEIFDSSEPDISIAEVDTEEEAAGVASHLNGRAGDYTLEQDVDNGAWVIREADRTVVVSLSCHETAEGLLSHLNR